MTWVLILSMFSAGFVCGAMWGSRQRRSELQVMGAQEPVPPWRFSK